MATLSEIEAAVNARLHASQTSTAAPPLGDPEVYRYAPVLRPPAVPMIAYGARRSRFALFVLLFASHACAALAGAYAAAKAAERADTCPVSAEAPRPAVWL